MFSLVIPECLYSTSFRHALSRNPGKTAWILACAGMTGGTFIQTVLIRWAADGLLLSSWMHTGSGSLPGWRGMLRKTHHANVSITREQPGAQTAVQGRQTCPAVAFRICGLVEASCYELSSRFSIDRLCPWATLLMSGVLVPGSARSTCRDKLMPRIAGSKKQDVSFRQAPTETLFGVIPVSLEGRVISIHTPPLAPSP